MGLVKLHEKYIESVTLELAAKCNIKKPNDKDLLH